MENLKNTTIFANVKDGDTFQVGKYVFIKFPDVDGKTPVVMKDVAFNSSFGGNNDLRESTVLKRMQEEILPQIVEVVGEENVLTFKTDLTTLDGLKPYEDLESRISLPTFDFYRANVGIFDQYNLGVWWWLATPESAKPHYDLRWIVCVSPSGYIYGNLCSRDIGVRPFLIFHSSIFGSSEE
jgi:hypothetical protein